MDQRLYEENLAYFEEVRELDSMTPKQRAEALARGEEVDRMPIFMMADLVLPGMLGETLKESEESAQKKAELQIAGYRFFGFDGIGMMHGLHSLPIALGGTFSATDHLPPTLMEPPISGLDELSSLKLENVGLRKDDAASKAFDALQIMLDEVGDEIACTMNFTAPFTVAAGILGIDAFLRGLARDGDRIFQLLDFTIDAQTKLAEPFLQAGISVGTSDPVASCDITNPRMYRKFAQPYEIEFAKRIREYTHKPVSIHICGNTTRILSDVADAGFGTFSLDNLVDMAVAKETVGDRMYLVGNVDPIAEMLRGTPESVTQAVYSCYAKTWDSPKGFAIHTGCDMPYGTSNENMKAYLLAAKRCAADQAKLLRGEDIEPIWSQAAEPCGFGS